jgi:hypothetical protein
MLIRLYDIAEEKTNGQSRRGSLNMYDGRREKVEIKNRNQRRLSRRSDADTDTGTISKFHIWAESSEQRSSLGMYVPLLAPKRWQLDWRQI